MESINYFDKFETCSVFEKLKYLFRFRCDIANSNKLKLKVQTDAH